MTRSQVSAAHVHLGTVCLGTCAWTRAGRVGKAAGRGSLKGTPGPLWMLSDRRAITCTDDSRKGMQQLSLKQVKARWRYGWQQAAKHGHRAVGRAQKTETDFSSNTPDTHATVSVVLLHVKYISLEVVKLCR